MKVTENPKTGDKIDHQSTIKLKATSAHPYRKEGEVFEVHPAHREQLFANKWVVEEEDTNTAVDGGAVPKTAEEAASTSTDDTTEGKSGKGKGKKAGADSE